MDTYPRSIRDLTAWASVNGVTTDEARRRFAQYAALCGIASVGPLRASLIFKGGNALDFVWQPNRSTLDLDFSLDAAQEQFVPNITTLQRLLQQALASVQTRFGVRFALQSMRQQPRGENRTRFAYEARVGYALSDEPRLLIRMANSQTSPHVIPIEISTHDPICDSTMIAIDDRVPQLRVSTLEDIVSEKLRALLQQPIRNRYRRQDLLDIALIVSDHPGLDRNRIAAFLQVKAAAREVSVSRQAFQNSEVATRAAVDYDALETTTRRTFIPFDDALKIVLAFIDELPIREK